MPTEPTCDLCNKQGLPLLLGRYAIAPIEAKTVKLSGSLSVKPSISLGQYAHYTTRLLRSGFVYVYDEARKYWTGYFVTRKGHLIRHDIGKPLPLALQTTEPCSYAGHKEAAGFITITSPRHASVVWIAFSDTQWTPAVLARHDSTAYRQRHMRRFDVKAWWATQSAAHAAKIGALAAVMSEYASATQAKAFDYSVAEFQARAPLVDSTIALAERMQPGKGVIVALDDPAGMAQDLAQLMQSGAKLFLERPENKRRLQLSQAIHSLREGIQNQAELQAIAEAERAAIQLANPSYGGGDGGRAANAGLALARSFNPSLDAKYKEMEERTRTLSAAQLDAARTSAWTKYSAKYDEAARAKWQSAFDVRLKHFDQIFVAPLAQAHANWMDSPQMAEHFSVNHDPADIHSGLGYTALFNLCIQGTQDKGACFKLYTHWFDASVRDTTALAMRALLMNQDALVEQAAKLGGGLDPRSVPWDAPLGAYNNTLELAGAAGQSVIAHTMMQLAGPIMAELDRFVDGPLRQGAAVIGLAAGAPVVRVTVTGGKKAFRAHVIRQLLALHGGKLDRHAMQRAVSAELRRLQLRGVPMDGTTKKTFLILADPAAVKGMPAGLTPQQRSEWLARSLRTIEQVDAADLERWRSIVNNKVRLGAAAGLLQVICFTKVASDKDGAMEHESLDAQGRYYAGMAVMAGTFGETVGTVMKNVVGVGRLRLAPQAMAGLGRLLVRWGGRATVAGGIALAALDARLGWAAKEEGQRGLAVLYGASFLLGGVAIFAFAISVPFGIIIVALFFLVTVLIELYKDDKLQDWLERTYWGRLPGQRYQNWSTEERELKLALAG